MQSRGILGIAAEKEMGHQMCLEAPFLEILVLWSTVEGESKMMPTDWSEAGGKYKDGTHWKKNIKKKIRR